MFAIQLVDTGEFIELGEEATLPLEFNNALFSFDDVLKGDLSYDFSAPIEPNRAKFKFIDQLDSRESFEMEYEVNIYLHGSFWMAGIMTVNLASSNDKYELYVVIGKSVLTETFQDRIRDVDYGDDLNLIGNRYFCCRYTTAGGNWCIRLKNVTLGYSRDYIGFANGTIPPFVGRPGINQDPTGYMKAWMVDFRVRSGVISPDDRVILLRLNDDIPGNLADWQIEYTRGALTISPNQPFNIYRCGTDFAGLAGDMAKIAMYANHEVMRMELNYIARFNLSEAVFPSIYNENFYPDTDETQPQSGTGWAGYLQFVNYYTNVAGGRNAGYIGNAIGGKNGYCQAIVPFFRFKKIYDAIKLHTRIDFDENLFEQHPFLLDWIIYNTKSLDKIVNATELTTETVNFWTEIIHIADHVPDLTVEEFFIQLKQLLCLTFSYNYAAQKLEIRPARYIVKSTEEDDWTDYFISFEKQQKDYKDVRIVFEVDPDDEYVSDTDVSKENYKGIAGPDIYDFPDREYVVLVPSLHHYGKIKKTQVFDFGSSFIGETIDQSVLGNYYKGSTGTGTVNPKEIKLGASTLGHQEVKAMGGYTYSIGIITTQNILDAFFSNPRNRATLSNFTCRVPTAKQNGNDSFSLRFLKWRGLQPMSSPAGLSYPRADVLSFTGTEGIYDFFWKDLCELLKKGPVFVITFLLPEVALRTLIITRKKRVGNQLFFIAQLSVQVDNKNAQDKRYTATATAYQF